MAVVKFRKEAFTINISTVASLEGNLQFWASTRTYFLRAEFTKKKSLSKTRDQMISSFSVFPFFVCLPFHVPFIVSSPGFQSPPFSMSTQVSDPIEIFVGCSVQISNSISSMVLLRFQSTTPLPPPRPCPLALAPCPPTIPSIPYPPFPIFPCPFHSIPFHPLCPFPAI